MPPLCVAVEWGVFGMARLIDVDALGIGEAKREAFTVPEYADGWNSAIRIIDAVPTVAAVPVSELLALRDSLYETDRITMSGLYDLNMLISKHDGRKDDGKAD